MPRTQPSTAAEWAAAVPQLESLLPRVATLSHHEQFHARLLTSGLLGSHPWTSPTSTRDGVEQRAGDHRHTADSSLGRARRRSLVVCGARHARSRTAVCWRGPCVPPSWSPPISPRCVRGTIPAGQLRLGRGAVAGGEEVGEEVRLNMPSVDGRLGDGGRDQQEWLSGERFLIGRKRRQSSFLTRRDRFRNEFLRRVVPWDKTSDSWNSFRTTSSSQSHRVFSIASQSARQLLSECMASHLRHKDVDLEYGSGLQSSSGRILLQSLPGTERCWPPHDEQRWSLEAGAAGLLPSPELR
ncbi:hypothetical protein C2845_PM10G07690 [Panicum miliaceum]|uniref:Uncharacterized protein n=1 Tax=Panicum miliaceum TaxID=4540 RepID=A0A3L6PJ38_PANMI|nr:hypothetical protein C2845_PM10G07690 [Panicum miliaceum]